MPRKSPGAIRAQAWAERRPGRSAAQIDGLSSRAQEAVAYLEATDLGLGAGVTASALVEYRRWLAQPGRWRYDLREGCPCCDFVETRDLLESVLRRLPREASAELRRIVAPLDEQLWRRTVPDPNAFPYSDIDDRCWWHHRLMRD